MTTSDMQPEKKMAYLLYVDRWDQDRLRFQDCRNYAPAFITNGIEETMKNLKFSSLNINFLETSEVARYEELIELLKNVQPTCDKLDIKGLPVDVVEKIVDSIHCQGNVDIYQKDGEDQRLLDFCNKTFFNKSNYYLLDYFMGFFYTPTFTGKLSVHMDNNDSDNIPYLFSQIKQFETFSFGGEKRCSMATFASMLHDLSNATDYGNLKKVILMVDDQNKKDAVDNPTFPEMEKLWDNQKLWERPGPSWLTQLRKFETNTKTILLAEGYRSKSFHILDKNLESVLDAILEEYRIRDMEKELRDEYCNKETTKERQAEIIRDAFKHFQQLKYKNW